MFSVTNRIKMQKDVPLARQTTFRIGGAARYFFVTETKDDLIRAVEFVKEKELPFFILGAGSNVLVSDDGFDGLAIKIQNSKIKIQNGNSKSKIIYAEAGVNLSDLVWFSIEKGLTGLEWAVGIPGTVGGAVKVNASAFGGEIKSLVKKTEKIDEIILSVELGLEKGNVEKSKKIIREIAKKRKETQPIGHFSAGCIFKNPSFQSAGYLIEQAGLKGKKIGGAMISQKHANFIVNLGDAKAGDVVGLIDLVKRVVKEKFNVQLEEEVEYIGF
jgi:UDP-N-acetylmuramate dehydrogenase